MHEADKVIFLMDRIELGTQSLEEYRNFADENEEVQATENTGVLVTSIQKMSNIKDEEGGLNANDLQLMDLKRIVFIVDEAHRSTFGKMLETIKNTFSHALFFGFTGTPIHDENQKKKNTTSTVFGNELHRYSIADGIRDKNVLGFDPYKVLTYKDKDLRTVVALDQAKANSEEEAFADPTKKVVFNKFLKQVKMAGYLDESGRYVKGVEDYLPFVQYRRKEHREKVVEDILENWFTLSQASKFHAIFATSSIPEAIEYYRLIKNKKPELKITALFDPNIDDRVVAKLDNEVISARAERGRNTSILEFNNNSNNDGVQFKEDGLVEIIEDYNRRYEQNFTFAIHDKFKKDIASRLAHKDSYKRVERTPEKQIDLLIVVDQMLTGFDSKWINTLYLDKLLQYESIIQAFSRTNRLKSLILIWKLVKSKALSGARKNTNLKTKQENLNLS